MTEVAPQWQQVELVLTGPATETPYLDIEAAVEFRHLSGETILRPAFWDGGRTWRVRFASTRADGSWRWRTTSATEAAGITPADGTLQATAGSADAVHPGLRSGFATMAPSQRGLVHADGSAALVVADTAWAMPWRATVEDVEHYARDRQAKGFNAVLLMSVQPDMRAEGPRGRGVEQGFEVGFEDLPEGHLNRINADYFQYLDAIVATLIAHGITPVLQPVFHGFGWKGLDVAGPVVPPSEYARYCRYLVARYGAQPVIYLVGADGAGTEPQIAAGGMEIQRTDAYGQPTGIHYRPHARNDAHQDADWLDFQWCQTGHEADHVPDRLATMWRNTPVKALMNAEPTYEHSGRRGKGEGWWQGHEAWSNFCAGGTMGVAYGAGSLWQWLINPDEPGHEPFFKAEGAGWREALSFEGSSYVGLVGKILAGLPLSNLEPCWNVSLCTRGLLDPGILYIGYAEHGGRWVFLDADGRVPTDYWLVDPMTGAVVASGQRPADPGIIEDSHVGPRVLICSTVQPAIAPGAAGLARTG